MHIMLVTVFTEGNFKKDENAPNPKIFCVEQVVMVVKAI